MADEPGNIGFTETPQLADAISAFRNARDELERNVLAQATSVDGRSFTLQASLHDLTIETGGYVVLTSGAQTRLGQVLRLEATREQTRVKDIPGLGSDVIVRLVRGEGIVLDRDSAPFHDAQVRRATSDEVAAWLDGQRSKHAQLLIGELLLAEGVSATLSAGGFDRHTFMCGQSGSGKTYTLGLLLEQLLLETQLRIIILDPNSDYVRLGHVRDGIEGARAATYAAAAEGVEVWGRETDTPLRLMFSQLDPAAQAAALGLDPIVDRDEYASMTDLVHGQVEGQPLITSLDDLTAAATPGARNLGLRASNLGVSAWSIWSRAQGRSLTDALVDDSARCMVVDLGSLDTVAEQRLIAQATLSTLWRSRHRRQPVLIVIDEAHNVCPREPADAVTKLAAETAAVIAAEGRKFGLYLLASTQRPQKVNEEVLTQCDNLLLMRMNSASDLEYLSEVFSFVPPGLIDRATTFRMGESLAAGKIFANPGFIKSASRISEEGGADVATDWARPKS